MKRSSAYKKVSYKFYALRKEWYNIKNVYYNKLFQRYTYWADLRVYSRTLPKNITFEILREVSDMDKVVNFSNGSSSITFKVLSNDYEAFINDELNNPYEMLSDSQKKRLEKYFGGKEVAYHTKMTLIY